VDRLRRIGEIYVGKAPAAGPAGENGRYAVGMGSIIVEQIVSADGFAADADRGIAFFEHDRSFHELDTDQMKMLAGVDAMILGANTYKMFAAFWPTEQSEGEVVAEWINTRPKHVISRSLERAPWGRFEPAKVERGDAVRSVAAVRDRYRGDVIVWGSLLLTETLFRADLVDRVRLRSVPRLIGAGVPVAPKDLGQRELELVECKAYPMGHVVLDYRVKR
jgi:dihydrofolate reductase